MKAKAQTTPIACIILAAGKGTRMHSKLSKVMHKIAHRPMLVHVVETALALGAQKIVTVTSPEMDSVREMIQRTYKDSVENVIQPHQRGTGDAVQAAKSLLDNWKGIVFVLYGDTPLIRAETLTKMVNALKSDPKAAITVLGMDIPAPNDYGRLVTDKKGSLERIVEARDATAKEKAITLCNSGVMAVRGKLLFTLLAKLSNKNAKGEYYLTDIVAHARKGGHTCAVVRTDAEELRGVNSRSELAQAEVVMQTRLRMEAMERGVTLIDPQSVFLACDTKLGQDTVIHPHVVFGPDVTVGDNVEIRSYSHIEGAKIAHHATIGPFARLRPGAVIGKQAHIGNFVEIKKSVIEAGAKANHLSYIGDAHVGENANIGAGTITCNYDGFTKHRTIIGAGAFIGSNTSLVAPVAIGEGAITGAGSVITEDVDADALAVERSPQKQKAHWAKSFRNRKKN